MSREPGCDADPRREAGPDASRDADDLPAGVRQRLERWPRRRLSLEELAGILVEARPELATSAERGDRLRSVIAGLVADGTAAPSSRRIAYLGADLPAFLVLSPRSPEPGPDLVRTYPWVPELAFVASGRNRIPEPTFQRLILLNSWLARRPSRGGPAPAAAPVRERSLEIFGDDKLLEWLLDGVLARSAPLRGRLAVYSVPVPMVVERVPAAVPAGGEVSGARLPGTVVLVVENATTFDSVLRAAREASGKGLPRRASIASGAPRARGLSLPDWVGYGAGAAAERSIASLADRTGSVSPPPGLAAALPHGAGLYPPIAQITYFGDLDAEGLEIAVRASAAAVAAGLPPVRPHERLYAMLLRLGRPQARLRPWNWSDAGLEWLGPDLAREVVARLGAGAWLAQEWVNIAALRMEPDSLVVENRPATPQTTP